MNEFLQAIGLIGQLGLNLFAIIFLGVIAGKYLDDKFSSAPLFLIIFLLVAIASSFRNLFVIIKKYFK